MANDPFDPYEADARRRARTQWIGVIVIVALLTVAVVFAILEAKGT